MEDMSDLWRERVEWRMSEVDAYRMLPPLQKTITFGTCFASSGAVVGRIPTLTDFMENALAHDVSDEERDFFTACALYDAQMGWFACDFTSAEGSERGVVHVSMIFPISFDLYEALRKVGCDPDKLGYDHQQQLRAFIDADTASTEAWALKNGVTE